MKLKDFKEWLMGGICEGCEDLIVKKIEIQDGEPILFLEGKECIDEGCKNQESPDNGDDESMCHF